MIGVNRVSVALFAGVILVFAGPIWADVVKAPLNGLASFGTESAPSDTLYVIAGSENVKATRADKIQGHLDSRITAVETPGTGEVHVADVTLRDGESLYRVTGSCVGGVGGTPRTWTADYNRGDPRVIMQLNGPSTEDDLIGLGVRWTQLELRLLAGVPDTEYTVTLSVQPAGMVDFGGAQVSLKAKRFEDKAIVYLWGGSLGDVTISGTCDQQATVHSADATVVRAIATPRGDPRLPVPNPDDGSCANATNEIPFNDAAVGVANVACVANRVLKDPNYLNWTVQPAGSIHAMWSRYVDDNREVGKGLDPLAKYEGLPSENQHFGLKSIALRAPAIEAILQPKGLSAGQATQLIELFFLRDEENHPGADETPNWFHYWRMTSANCGTMEYDPQTALFGYCDFSDPPDYPCYLGPAAATTSRTPSVGANANMTLSGIDLFAFVARHEWRHHEQGGSWWGPDGYLPLLDDDFDFIPDCLEEFFDGAEGGPFSPDWEDTYLNDGVRNDCERHAHFTQGVWNFSADHEDWASPGKQYQH